MEDAAELHHSDSDEVILFDDKMTGGLGSKESAAMLIHCLFLSRQTRTAKRSYPFLENTNNRDVMLLTIF
jgi:hypothetical protein